tara:strand:- start:95 stop:664 length:570 start_codon:yes stop_codon:yes gene_type:complete
MKDQSKNKNFHLPTLIIAISALGISIFNTLSSNESNTVFEKSSEKTYLNPDPKSKNNLNTLEKNMLNSPLTPQTNNTINLPKTYMSFKEEMHEFGNVDVNSKNNYSFSFTNTGNEPLKITNARGSCGCTVPDFPRDPIMPGQTSKIDVVFTPSKGQAGTKQTKTVTVTANTDPENTILKITAFVNKMNE